MIFLDNSELAIVHSTDRYLVGKAKKDLHRITKDGDYFNPGHLISENELCGSFKGINSFLDYLNTYQAVPKKGKESDKNGGEGFNAFDSYGTAFEVYSRTPSKVRSFTESDELLKDGENAGVAFEYGVTGDFLDIGRYLEGEPESMGIMNGGNPRGKRVNVYVNTTFPWFVHPESINRRGVRVQRLVDWLESQQIRVSVTALMSARSAHLEIEVKDHDSTLDINDIAVFSHSDFFRRLGFRFMEYSDTWNDEYGHGRILDTYLRGNKPVTEYLSEINIMCNNNFDSVESVDEGYDNVEVWLRDNMADDITEDTERTRVVN